MRSGSQQRRKKIPTPENLANIALHYLSRYASSEASLRRVLQNRLRRVALLNPAFAQDKAKQDELHLAIETIIGKHRKSGVLNDAAYAETKAISLRRAGKSRRDIRMRLERSGVQGEVIDKAFAVNDGDADPNEIELKAAMALARKKRIGPFRTREKNDDSKRKDFAALARAGFGIDIIRKVIGGEVPEDFDVF